MEETKHFESANSCNRAYYATQNYLQKISISIVFIFLLSSGSACPNPIATIPINEDFETNAFVNWSQDFGDDFDWIIHTGATTSGSTGPSAAYNGTYYAYIEASTPNNPSKVANLISPCFMVQSGISTSISFAYHMYGGGMGDFNVDISTNDGASWANIWGLSGNQGDVWNMQSLSLNAYSGQSVKLRFNVITGSYQSDVAIDNVVITNSSVGEICDDNMDNDGDGLTDEYDPDCGVVCYNDCTTPYLFSWYDGTGSGNVWEITNGENNLTRVYTIDGSQGEYNVSVTLDNPDGQNIDLSNCGFPGDHFYTATCNDPSGSANCDGDPNTVDGQFTYGCDFLTFGITADNSAQKTSITYDFEFPSQICNLLIGDIDHQGTAFTALESWQDEVEVTAALNGTPVSINAIVGSKVHVFNNNTDSLTLISEYNGSLDGNLLHTDPDGHATITTLGKVTTITFTYSNGPDDEGQSDDHAIRINGFEFCPEEKAEICENGLDDDEDGFIDCEDIDCGLLDNIEFKDGTASWNHNNYLGNASTFTIDVTGQLSGNNSAKIELTNVGSQVWFTQFEQNNLSIEIGKTYRVHFDAKSSISRNIQVMVQKTGLPFTTYFVQDVPTANFHGQYVFEFTASATDANVDLTFNLGQDLGTVWLDKIQLKEVCPDPECLLPSDESYTICNGELISSSVASNDQTQEETFNTTYQITLPPVQGNVVLEENGNFVYTPNPGANGVDAFTYERCYSFENAIGLSNVIFNPCGDGKIIESFIEGIEGESSPSILISNPSDFTQIVVEVWAESACGTVTIEGVLADETDLFRTDGTVDVEKLYRVELNAVSLDGLINISSSGGCILSSAAAYVEREEPNGQGSSSLIESNVDLYFGYVGGDDCFVYNMPIGNSGTPRDITFTIPLHEKDNIREVNAKVIAGSISGTGSTTSWSAIGVGAGLIEITLANVPGDISVASIEVCSPDTNGDSFGVGLISATSLICTEEPTFDCCSEATALINISSASIANSNPGGCSGSVYSVLTASDNSSSLNYSYTWSHSAETTAQVVVNPSVTTTYFVTVTNDEGCMSTAETTVVVYPDIDAIIDYNGQICLDENSQLSALVTGGTPIFQYTWTGPNGFSETDSIVDITEDGNYNLTVTDAAGCSTSTTAFVYEAYEPFIFTLNSQICEGEDVTLSVNGASGGTFQWGPNANNATTSSVTVTPGFPSTTYNVTVTNSIGCTTSANAVIDVIAKPIVNVTGPTDICIGTTTQLSPSSGGIWTSSNYSIANVSSTGLVTGLGNGSATFTFKDDITGCYSDPTTPIMVNPNAPTSISGDDDICIGENPTLTASMVGGTWSSSNTAVATIHSSSGTVTPVSSGVTTITYDPSSLGCYSGSTYNINIHEIPALTINGPSTICEGDITYLSASTSGTWTSSNINVATVSAAGEVLGVGQGTATFSFVSSVGCSAVLGTPIIVVENLTVVLTGPNGICVNQTTNLSPTSGGVWISSNSAVASVNNAGVVTGNSAGNATFTFIEATNGCVSDNTISVTVSAIPTISAPSTNALCIGETASITPGNGGSWTSTNPAVASITNGGLITALSGGSATFTFTNNITGCSSAASTPITVQPNPTTNFSGPTSICKGEMTSILPSSGGYWFSSNVSVATITNGGIITGVSPGTVKFIFTNSNSGCVSDSSNVLTVIQPAIVNVAGPTDLCIGETSNLTPNSGGAWFSSDINIATVTNDGIVTAVSQGTVTFTFQNSSGCSSEPTEEITVYPNPSVNYNGTSMICVGESTSLSPSSGGTWSSTNTGIATITNSGIVTAVSVGAVSFTFTDLSSGCTATTEFDLIVNDPPSISITGDDEICIGDITTLFPFSGGFWISSDNSIATISSNGTVTGLSAGDVTFTFIESSTGCTSEDSAPITVLPRPDVAIDGPNTICVGSSTTLSPSIGGIWSSDNESVATVTNSGIVTGVSQGLARFTFTSNQGCTSNETAPIIIYNKPNVLVDGPNSICIGSNAQMVPSSGGTWQSLNPTVANIDNTGLVTGLTSGIATFVFTDSSTGCVSDPSAPITVEDNPTTSLNGPDEICIGGSTNMTPSTGGIWTSLNPLVASIQNNGAVEGLSAGIAKFIFMNITTGCYSDTTSGITVLAGPTISFNGPTDICVGDTSYMLPSSGGTWLSTNTDVATINNSGMIIGIGSGNTRFEFTETSSNCKSELSDFLTVNGPPVVGVNGPSTICIASETFLTPSSGGTWESLNPGIAGVDANGLVTGISEGTAFFVFTDGATGCTSDDTLNIEVQAAPIIEITGNSTICLGYTTTLAPGTSGLWMSSNPAIATASNSGIVTGHAPGIVTFQFIDPVTGCISEESSDPITIENCTNHDFNVTLKDEIVYGNLNTNDKISNTAVYGGNIETVSKPLNSIPTVIVNLDGTYSFVGDKAGKYLFRVPICIPPTLLGCSGTFLEINVVENVYAQSNPVSNLEFTTTYRGSLTSDPGQMVVIDALANDTCVYAGLCALDESTISILKSPASGSAIINSNYEIEYTSNPNFVGLDTIDYSVCLSDGITCSRSQQIIIVNHPSALNSTVANDDFYFTLRETTVSGNVLDNDYDPEGESMVALAAGSVLSPVVMPEGSYFIDAAGAFTFIPEEGFVGTANIVYQICDNQAEPYCTDATIHLLVLDDISLNIRVYLEGALIANGGEETQSGLPMMRNDLRVSPFTGENYIPISDPHSFDNDPFINTEDKFTQVGPGLFTKNQFILDSLSVFSVEGENAIVDWIHVEIRSKSDNTVVLGTRSGLVQRDGDVVDIDGVSNLRFQGINADSFYVVVKHRSHLGAMSELVTNDDLIDFTDQNFPVFNFGTSYGNGLDYAGLSRNNFVVYGFSALWAGDFDSNGKVKFVNPNDDQNILFLGVLFSSPDFLINYDNAYGYFTSDYDMNSKSKYTNPNDDLNLLFSQILLYPLNTAFLSNFNALIEQVPK